jgi:uncharacterized protein (TIGR00255 family)
MTGFGRASGPLGPAWTAEIVVRSVNHRFLDLTVKIRDGEAALEPVLRRVFSRHVARGKVEVSLRLRRAAPAAHEIEIDETLLETLLARFALLSQKYPVTGRLEARDLLTIPQIFNVETASQDLTEEEVAALEAIADEAAAALVGMREAEGTLIGSELGERVAVLAEKTRRLTERREEIARRLAETLRERVHALFPAAPLDPGRLEQEAALAADRSDVAEELSRLDGHLQQFAGYLTDSAGPVGKKLDFLIQEVLRELNTLGSKARDLQIVRDVLDMKGETEKIREQVQNLE